MKVLHLFEESNDDKQYLAWQKECRQEAENCQFTGSCTGGAQAVDWDTPNNRCVGDWDGKKKTGTIYKNKK